MYFKTVLVWLLYNYRFVPFRFILCTYITEYCSSPSNFQPLFNIVLSSSAYNHLFTSSIRCTMSYFTTRFLIWSSTRIYSTLFIGSQNLCLKWARKYRITLAPMIKLENEILQGNKKILSIHIIALFKFFAKYVSWNSSFYGSMDASTIIMSCLERSTQEQRNIVPTSTRQRTYFYHITHSNSAHRLP